MNVKRTCSSLAKCTKMGASFAVATLLALSAGNLSAEIDIYGNEVKVIDGQTYQFLIFGNPETAAMADSDSGVSSPGMLATGRLADSGVQSIELEARYRTSDDSDATALDSTKYRATIIIFR